MQLPAAIGSTLLSDALDVQRGLDLALATRVEETPWGPAVFREDLPRVADLNVLVVERGTLEAGALKLMAEAERLQAGLPQRAVRLDEPDAAAFVAPEFAASGWIVSRTAVMVLRRMPDRAIDTRGVELVDVRWLRGAREAASRRVHRDLDVAAQAVELGSLQHDDARLEPYAALVRAEVAAYCLLRIGAKGAKLVEVQALARAQGHGVGRATIWAAAFAARRRQISPVLVECEDEQWAKSVYHRLGFDEVGKVYRLVRPWGD
jgi:GNAT superfamily N-acetyltransferase